MVAQTVLRRPQVEKLTGLKRSAIYAGIAEGSFPKPIKISDKAVAWLESEIAEWQQDKIAARDGTKRQKAA